MLITTQDLDTSESADYYANYIKQVPSDLSMQAAFDKSYEACEAYLQSVPEQYEHYAYADGKWTISQSIQHLIDTERVLAYRALRYARGDRDVALQAFSQDAFADYAGANSRSIASLLEEWKLLRKSNQLMFDQFTAVELKRTGKMGDYFHTVRAIGFVIIGHTYHHASLFHAKYQYPSYQ